MLDNVVIIGASSSLGGAVVEHFRTRTHKTVATYCSKPPIIVETVHWTRLDMTEDESINNGVGQIAALLNGVKACIFMPGLLPGKPLADYEPGEMERVMAVNFLGQAKVLKKLLPLLLSDACILMISSISAQKGSYDPIYSASKGAVISFVKSMAPALGANIRINAVAPGLTEGSTMYNEMSESRRAFHQSQIPSRRFLQREDFAAVLFDLTQPQWLHLNGACIDLNGGQYLR